MSQEISRRIEIGVRIKKIRTDKNMTGKELSNIAQISQGYLSEVERGLSEVSGEKLMRIAEGLGVGVQDLIARESALAEAKNSLIIPNALSEAAEDLGLSFSHTVRLLQGAHSLMARRSSGTQSEWTKQQWKDFYGKVKLLLEE